MFLSVFDLQIPATTTRILLNHFRWDKEKLMERYYDGDQEALFKAAHVINPYVKPKRESKVISLLFFIISVSAIDLPPAPHTHLDALCVM